jgi:hypothetical protein
LLVFRFLNALLVNVVLEGKDNGITHNPDRPHAGAPEQGNGVGPFEQFKDLASILAVEVLPTPLGPEKR